jgi:hypothetical protein
LGFSGVQLGRALRGMYELVSECMGWVGRVEEGGGA